MPGYRGFELKKYDKDLTEAIGRALPTLKEDKEFMDGYKTWTGLIVTLLGYAGVAQYFGGQEGAMKFIDALVQLVGMIIAVYGNYKAHQKIKKLKK